MYSFEFYASLTHISRNKHSVPLTQLVTKMCVKMLKKNTIKASGVIGLKGGRKEDNITSPQQEMQTNGFICMPEIMAILLFENLCLFFLFKFRSF